MVAEVIGLDHLLIVARLSNNAQTCLIVKSVGIGNIIKLTAFTVHGRVLVLG